MERRPAAALLGLIVCFGCTRHDGRTEPPPRASTVVRIVNSSWMDVTVFVVRGITRTRVGFVNALSSATFPLPDASMPDRTVWLLIDPVGSDAVFETGGIAVNPGQRVEVSVMPSLAMSNVAVWPR